MSFINLLGNVVFSEADIVNRTEAMISSEFPKTRYDILMRKVQGQSFGYVLTTAEQAELARYQELCYYAGAQADAARADRVLLNGTLTYEVAVKRLALEPIIDSEQDALERAEAQAVLDTASIEVIELYTLRNPVIVVEGLPI